MPGLFLYKSNRLETLAEELAGVLRKPLASPFKQEIILVQSKGMERWVTMELARLQGICANCRFPFPNHFVYGLFRDILPDVPESSPFEPSTLTWKVMDVLPSKLKGKAFAPLKNYLCEDPAGLKLYQVSQRIADLFDQYLLFRPEMVLRWEAGKEDDWQAALWREVAKGGEGKHRAALRQAFMRELPKSGEKLSRLPERISVFGISALPGFHLEILEAVSASIEVNLFLMNPCREYWGDLLTRREERRVKEKARKYAGGGDLHIEKGNSLLASTGMLGRDFFDLISEWPVREKENFVDPGDGSLLCCLQSDILNLREKKPGERRILRDDDDSIRVHSCHSAMREVEVLQDSLLSWFEADGSLLPKDVLVMTPDIAAYSPFIQAVFSLPPGDPRSIPFSIADRGVRQESEAAEVFLSLLEFQGSRYGVSQVLSVLESGPVQKKFSISGEDLDRIRLWVRETRVRWGVDDRSRAELGLPPFGENTWRAALDRMLLGYAMPGRGEKMIRGILPYDAIEGSEAAALGRLAAVCDALFSLGKELSAERTLGEWGEFLAGVVDRFLLSDEDTERDILFIRRALRDLGEKESASGFAKKIPLAVIKAHLRLSLETEGFGSGFLTGGVTFCAMLPMRSIPFRAICLLGMNDDAYPRQEKALGFDRMARRPMPGDRSRRNDDRYLFLESLLSAREKIHISYTGQSAEDNTPRPPSVLVSELLDSIEEGFASDAGEIRDRIVTKHRLQAFSPEYFGKNARLFSYSAENLEAARQLLSPPEERKPFLSRLSEPGPESRNVDIRRLVRFFSGPARFLLNDRLGIYLEEENASFDEVEPFEVKGLDRYLLEQDLADRGCENRDLRGCYATMKASGQLPHGRPGECFFEETCREVEKFVEGLKPYRAEPRPPIELDLQAGEFRIGGRIENLFSRGFVYFRCADVKAQDRLRTWIHVLVLNALGESSATGILVCKDAIFQYPPPGTGAEKLREILDVYWTGLQTPIHFFPRSSFAYAEALHQGKERTEALARALETWEGNGFSSWNEGDDPYFKLCFGGTTPLDEAFEELARMIYLPILEIERGEE